MPKEFERLGSNLKGEGLVNAWLAAVHPRILNGADVQSLKILGNNLALVIPHLPHGRIREIFYRISDAANEAKNGAIVNSVASGLEEKGFDAHTAALRLIAAKRIANSVDKRALIGLLEAAGNSLAQMKAPHTKEFGEFYGVEPSRQAAETIGEAAGMYYRLGMHKESADGRLRAAKLFRGLGEIESAQGNYNLAATNYLDAGMDDMAKGALRSAITTGFTAIRREKEPARVEGRAIGISIAFSRLMNLYKKSGNIGLAVTIAHRAAVSMAAFKPGENFAPAPVLPHVFLKNAFTMNLGRGKIKDAINDAIKSADLAMGLGYRKPNQAYDFLQDTAYRIHRRDKAGTEVFLRRAKALFEQKGHSKYAEMMHVPKVELDGFEKF